MDEGLRILADVRRETGLPVLTDVHEREQIAAVAAVVDVLQTPAFLCRQTDFIVAVAAAGQAGQPEEGTVPLARGRWSAWSRRRAATGNQDLLVTERGFAFGYNNLVSDMRALAGARARRAARWSSTPPTACSCRAAQGTASGGDRALRRAARARGGRGRRRRGASSRCTRIPTARSPTARRACRLADLPALLAPARGASTARACARTRRDDRRDALSGGRGTCSTSSCAGADGACATASATSFERAIDVLLACRGKVVVTGIGKSGLVGRKIAATLRQHRHAGVLPARRRGQPRRSRHRSRAATCCVALSYSGETPRVLAPAPARAAPRRCPLVAITGAPASTLARAADVVARRERRRTEACPLGLAPTASTTATMALGDALAVALLEERGFTAEDFALLHPGGALGRRLAARRGRSCSAATPLPRVPERRAAQGHARRDHGEAPRHDRGRRRGRRRSPASSPTATCVAALERAADIRALTVASDLMTRTPKTIAPRGARRRRPWR